MAVSRREGQGVHKPPAGRLRPAVHEMIGRSLRLHYEDLQQQPLPGRLARLLEALEAADPAEPRRS